MNGEGKMCRDVFANQRERQAKIDGGDRKPIATWYCRGHFGTNGKNYVPCTDISCMVKVFEVTKLNLKCQKGFVDPHWEETHGVNLD